MPERQGSRLFPSGEKLATEAPVNGGRNYDGPKVNFEFCSNSHALEKSGHMLETLSIRRYSPMSKWAVTIRSVQAISRKGHCFRNGILRDHTPDDSFS